MTLPEVELVNVPPWLSALWLSQPDGTIVGHCEDDKTIRLTPACADPKKPSVLETTLIREAKGTYAIDLEGPPESSTADVASRKTSVGTTASSSSSSSSAQKKTDMSAATPGVGGSTSSTTAAASGENKRTVERVTRVLSLLPKEDDESYRNMVAERRKAAARREPHITEIDKRPKVQKRTVVDTKPHEAGGGSRLNALKKRKI
ncbi:unnamed protein product [Amoebophrya sp. A25]|nr:unnamed protein product [Amoebophrya sp. A25]|eukprot:GSA25T00008865001.1